MGIPPELIEGTAIIGGSLIVAIGGMYIVRHFVPREALEENHEVAGYMLAIVGTLYAILLGLIVVNVQSKYELASTMAETEANCLSDICHLSYAFPEKDREAIREVVYSYAVDARDQDWAKIAEGKSIETTIPHYRKLWKTINQLELTGSKQEATYSNLLTKMGELSDARRFRMIAANGLSPALWAVLIAGEILIVWFTYFFFVQRAAAQLIMTTFVVLFLSLNVFLVYLFNNPYRKILSGANSAAGVNFRPEWFTKESVGPH